MWVDSKRFEVREKRSWEMGVASFVPAGLNDLFVILSNYSPKDSSFQELTQSPQSCILLRNTFSKPLFV